MPTNTIWKDLKNKRKIALIAPSGPVDKDKFFQGVDKLRQLGFQVLYHEKICKNSYITAGSAEKRSSELKKFLQLPEAEILWCVRGGYGAIDLIDLIPANLYYKKNEKKILIGMSDATILHLFWDHYDISPTIYGPMPATSYFIEAEEQLEKSLKTLLLEGDIRSNFQNMSFKVLNNNNTEIIQSSIIGGCLSLCTSSIGTEIEIDLQDKVFFFEEINEPFYRLDLMINQLYYAGKFQKCKAIIVGSLVDCLEDKEELTDVLSYLFRKIKLPILYDLPVGHINNSMFLPFGEQIKINLLEKKIYM